MEKRKVFYNRYAFIYLFYYGSMGVITPMIGQYLKYIGFSGKEIGLITSIATAAGIIAPTFWGLIFQRSSRKKLMVFNLYLVTALLVIALLTTKVFFIFVGIYVLKYLFSAPIVPLTDSLAINEKFDFGGLRKWGAVGFACAAFIIGQLAQAFTLSWIFPVSAGFILVSAINVIPLVIEENRALKKKEVKGKLCSEKVKPKYRDLLGNKKYIKLIICIFFMLGPSIANNTYLGFLYVDVGGTISGLGMVFFLMAGSETPFMAWSKKIAEKLSLEKLLLFAMFISALRFFLYSLGVPYWLIIVTFFLQGFSNGILLVEGVKYVAKLVKAEYVAMAISLYAVLGNNLSIIMCQLFGGIILEEYGSQAVYVFFTIFNIIGIVLYMSFGLHKRKLIYK